MEEQRFNPTFNRFAKIFSVVMLAMFVLLALLNASH